MKKLTFLLVQFGLASCFYAANLGDNIRLGSWIAITRQELCKEEHKILMLPTRTTAGDPIANQTATYLIFMDRNYRGPELSSAMKQFLLFFKCEFNSCSSHSDARKKTHALTDAITKKLQNHQLSSFVRMVLQNIFIYISDKGGEYGVNETTTNMEIKRAYAQNIASFLEQANYPSDVWTDALLDFSYWLTDYEKLKRASELKSVVGEEFIQSFRKEEGYSVFREDPYSSNSQENLEQGQKNLDYLDKVITLLEEPAFQAVQPPLVQQAILATIDNLKEVINQEYDRFADYDYEGLSLQELKTGLKVYEKIACHAHHNYNYISHSLIGTELTLLADSIKNRRENNSNDPLEEFKRISSIAEKVSKKTIDVQFSLHGSVMHSLSKCTDSQI